MSPRRWLFVWALILVSINIGRHVLNVSLPLYVTLGAAIFVACSVHRSISPPKRVVERFGLRDARRRYRLVAFVGLIPTLMGIVWSFHVPSRLDGLLSPASVVVLIIVATIVFRIVPLNQEANGRS